MIRKHKGEKTMKFCRYLISAVVGFVVTVLADFLIFNYLEEAYYGNNTIRDRLIWKIYFLVILFVIVFGIVLIVMKLRRIEQLLSQKGQPIEMQPYGMANWPGQNQPGQNPYVPNQGTSEAASNHEPPSEPMT